jgi:hypothetical protein
MDEMFNAFCLWLRSLWEQVVQLVVSWFTG